MDTQYFKQAIGLSLETNIGNLTAVNEVIWRVTGSGQSKHYMDGDRDYLILKKCAGTVRRDSIRLIHHSIDVTIENVDWEKLVTYVHDNTPDYAIF